VQWVFLCIIVGSIAFAAQVVLAFLESWREKRARNEEDQVHVLRLEDQLKESEHARTEAEDRAARLEEESLLLEQKTSALQEEIRKALPTSSDASTDAPRGA